MRADPNQTVETGTGLNDTKKMPKLTCMEWKICNSFATESKRH